MCANNFINHFNLCGFFIWHFSQVACLIYQIKLLKSTLFLNFFLTRYVKLRYAFQLYQRNIKINFFEIFFNFFVIILRLGYFIALKSVFSCA